MCEFAVCRVIRKRRKRTKRRLTALLHIILLHKTSKCANRQRMRNHLPLRFWNRSLKYSISSQLYIYNIKSSSGGLLSRNSRTSCFYQPWSITSWSSPDQQTTSTIRENIQGQQALPSADLFDELHWNSLTLVTGSGFVGGR